MRKIQISLAALMVLSLSFVQTSCIGGFKLTNKVYDFNKNLGSKFVNELVFLLMVIVPVYEISLLIDGLIINSIEFWTGSNPMAMNTGETETKIIEQNGTKYQVTASHNRFDFIQLEGVNKGVSGALVYDDIAGIWSYEDGLRSLKLLKLNADGTAAAFLPNGKQVDLVVGSDGLATLKSALKSYHFMAEK